jgi:hypothetical protein
MQGNTNEEVNILNKEEIEEEQTKAFDRLVQILQNAGVDEKKIVGYLSMAVKLGLLPEQLIELTVEDIEAIWQKQQENLEEQKRAAREELEALKRSRPAVRGSEETIIEVDEVNKWERLGKDLKNMAEQEARQRIREEREAAALKYKDQYLNRAERRARAKAARRG